MVSAHDGQQVVAYLDVFAEAQVAELEVCSGPSWDRFAVLIQHNHVREISVGGILTNLFQRISLESPQQTWSGMLLF